jgi:hypothetical protein
MTWFNWKKEPPLCIDCKFYKREPSSLGGVNNICLHPRMVITTVNLITGPETFHPSCDRSAYGCGRRGRYFEPKRT